MKAGLAVRQKCRGPALWRGDAGLQTRENACVCVDDPARERSSCVPTEQRAEASRHPTYPECWWQR